MTDSVPGSTSVLRWWQPERTAPEFGESDEFRHSRAGGKPVVRGILGSRLRGNDEVGGREVNPGLFQSYESNDWPDRFLKLSLIV
jgi:hypothetical protein